MPPFADLFRCVDGGWSCMRVIAFLTCTVVLLVWALSCLFTQQWIPIDWPMVTLLGAAQGAKAWQTRFEHFPPSPLQQGGLSSQGSEDMPGRHARDFDPACRPGWVD